MRHVLVSMMILSAGAAVTLPPAARAATTAQTLEDREQAACYDDAQRLCPDGFPDVDKVKACMKDKKKLVSKACAEFYPKGG